MLLFVTVLAASIGVIGALLWFTGWAEQTIVSPESPSVEAKTR